MADEAKLEDEVIQAAVDAGAPGATYFYGRGTGVRQKLGLLGRFILRSTIRTALIWPGLLTLTGCDRANGFFLERDLGALAADKGVELPGLSCRMISGTRTGFCAVQLEPEKAERLIAGLELRRLQSGSPLPLGQAFRELDLGCRTLPGFHEISGTPSFWTQGRPAGLRLKNGTAFEYLILLRAGTPADYCVQLAYSYG